MDTKEIAKALIAKHRKAEADEQDELNKLLASLPPAEGLSWTAREKRSDRVTLNRDSDGQELGNLSRHTDGWVIWTDRLTGKYTRVGDVYETASEAAEMLFALMDLLDAEAAEAAEAETDG